MTFSATALAAALPSAHHLEAALDCAERGWPVFPVHTVRNGRCSCGAPDGDDPTRHRIAKHPVAALAPNGFYDATTDPDAIRAWWGRMADANIAVRTGKGGADLLVIDPDLEAEDAWHELEREHGVPVTVEQLTGGGGHQLLFRRPPVESVPELGGASGRLPDHVDVRCDGGYIVVPPSLHATGRRYEWSVDNHPDDVAVADPPDWLLDLIGDGGGYTTAEPLRLAPEQVIPEGSRNTTLTRYGGAMRRYGFDEVAIRAALLEVNRLHCRPALPERDVAGVARSVARYEPDEPVLSRRAPLTASVTREHDLRQLLTGSDLLDLPDTIPAVWGSGQRVAWAQGERLLVCAPQGVGKSVLAQHLALARAGLGAHDVLGMPVHHHEGRKVLYLAMDRPPQAARSIRRMLDSTSRAQLGERLLWWKGAVPVNLLADPESLLEWVTSFGDVGTLIVDSVKDLAPGISKDEVGSAIDHALRRLSLAEIETLALHHPRKQQQEKGASPSKPQSLDEVYGSVWITSGSGSVLLLWGEPGDVKVELSTLKPEADEIGPLTVIHDKATGAISARRKPSVVELVAAAGSSGMSAKEVSLALGDGDAKSAVERTRRRLDQAVDGGRLDREDGTRRIASRWYLRATARDQSVIRSREGSRGSRFGSSADHADDHGDH